MNDNAQIINNATSVRTKHAKRFIIEDDDESDHLQPVKQLVAKNSLLKMMRY